MSGSPGTANLQVRDLFHFSKLLNQNEANVIDCAIYYLASS